MTIHVAMRSYAQSQFAEMLAKTPWLESYWDFERRECNVARLKRDMRAWSHGEIIMARFMVAVWRGANEFKFDPIEAASVLGPEQRVIVAEWIARPFWP